MKAEIDQRGVLHVIPEDETEAYAMKKWRIDAKIVIQVEDLGAPTKRNEQHWRAESLDFNPNWPRQIGDCQ